MQQVMQQLKTELVIVAIAVTVLILLMGSHPLHLR